MIQAKVRVPDPPDWLVTALISLLSHGANPGTPELRGQISTPRARYVPPHMRQALPAGSGIRDRSGRAVYLHDSVLVQLFQMCMILAYGMSLPLASCGFQQALTFT